MLQIIPAIDILDGNVVRLTQGDYTKSKTYTFTPVELAKHYESNGATRIHLVDLNGAKEGKRVNQSVFESIRNAVSCELQLGGGIRNQTSVTELFDCGIDYVILGSLLTKDITLSLSIAEAFPNKIIAGIDAKDQMVKIEGWGENSNITVEALLSKINHAPWNSVVATDISKDGMLDGPNFEFLKTLSTQTPLPIIASGGVTTSSDITLLKKMGLFGCIVGKALLHNTIDINTLWSNTHD